MHIKSFIVFEYLMWFGFSAGFPLQGQPSLHGLQLPAAVCAGLLCLPHHPQGEIFGFFCLLVHLCPSKAKLILQQLESDSFPDKSYV